VLEADYVTASELNATGAFSTFSFRSTPRNSRTQRSILKSHPHEIQTNITTSLNPRTNKMGLPLTNSSPPTSELQRPNPAKDENAPHEGTVTANTDNSSTSTASASTSAALKDDGPQNVQPDPAKEREAERLYEERIEEEYAKREGGA